MNGWSGLGYGQRSSRNHLLQKDVSVAIGQIPVKTVEEMRLLEPRVVCKVVPDESQSNFTPITFHLHLP